MSKETTDRIPFNVFSIVIQLLGWAFFFGVIVAAYATVVQNHPKPTTDQLIDQLGYHQ